MRHGRAPLLQSVLISIVFISMISPARAEGKKVRLPDDIAATVNGQPISKGEFDGEVVSVEKALLERGRPLTGKQIESVRSEVLESMIRRELLYQESRKSGIKSDEKALNKEINSLKRQFLNENEFRRELKRRNISEEVLLSRLEKNSAIEQYIEKKFAEKLSVADKEMVAYYESHVNVFRQPSQVRLRHILIRTGPGRDESQKEEARRKAENILKEVRDGKDFAALARGQSDGPERTNGGDLGYISKGQLTDKQLENVIFSLKPGETSEIIESNSGFHLFKVVERKPATVLAYESVKDRIKQYLVQEKAKQEAEQYAKTLRGKADVKIFTDQRDHE